MSTNLDFEILEVDNLNVIVFADYSSYGETPTNPIVQIIIPGNTNIYTAEVGYGTVTILNSETIGLTAASGNTTSFADGIYSITYAIDPHSSVFVQKYYYKVDSLNNKIKEIYSKIECSNYIIDYPYIKKELIDSYILIESAKANALLNNVNKATIDYIVAQKKIHKIFESLE